MDGRCLHHNLLDHLRTRVHGREGIFSDHIPIVVPQISELLSLSFTLLLILAEGLRVQEAINLVEDVVFRDIGRHVGLDARIRLSKLLFGQRAGLDTEDLQMLSLRKKQVFSRRIGRLHENSIREFGGDTLRKVGQPLELQTTEDELAVTQSDGEATTIVSNTEIFAEEALSGHNIAIIIGLTLSELRESRKVEQSPLDDNSQLVDELDTHLPHLALIEVRNGLTIESNFTLRNRLLRETSLRLLEIISVIPRQKIRVKQKSVTSLDERVGCDMLGDQSVD